MGVVPDGFSPVAIQVLRLGQDTSFSPPTPLGTERGVQTAPPSEVVRTIPTPGPPRGPIPPPTTTQVVVVRQAMLKRSVVPDGGDWDVQDLPASLVAKRRPDGEPSAGVSFPTT